MSELKKILESKMKIRFHDCDPFNHLNNSRYIDYMVTARGDQLIDHYGFDIYKLGRERGLGWVSALTQVSYMIPALLMEEVTIQTQLIGYSNKSLHLEALMWDADKINIKALMWTKLVHFNLATQRSEQHDEAMMALFQQVALQPATTLTFEERIRGLQQR